MAAAKARLKDIVELLSNDECESIAPLFEDVAAGERFWERDIALCYNEHVKARPVVAKRGLKVGVNTPPKPLHTGDDFVSIPIVKHRPDRGRIELPPPPALTLGLGEALRTRRSRRGFTGADASREQISGLLHHAAGINDHTAAYGFSTLARRPFPSSGGLQSPELYVGVQHVEGVAPGIYHYSPQRHALETLREGDFSAFLAAHTFNQSFVEQAAVTLVLTGVYERLRWKYGERSYRYVCMDGGFLAQNLYLVGEALGLGVCAIAGFYDEDFERLLQLNPVEEVVLLLLAVGRCAGDE